MTIQKEFLTRNRRTALACLVLALGAGTVAFIGVSFRSAGATVTTTTVRGESVEWVASGPYAYNAVRVVAEGVAWDWVTLVLAVPSLALSTRWVARGSVSGRLIASGIVAYLFYQYLQYAVIWALGPLFPGFIVLFAASLWVLVLLLGDLAPGVLSRPWPTRYPRLGLACLCFAVSAVLVFLWTDRIAQGLTGPVQGILLGQTTLGVQALDLGLVVPMAVWTAIQTLTRRPVALLFGPVLMGKAVFMATAIVAMLLSAWAVEGRLEVVPLVMFMTAAGASAYLGFRALRSL